MTPAYKQAVAQANYLMWDWNIDSKDWFYRDQRYVDSVIGQLQKNPGKGGTVVILLHERKETLQYLPKLLNYLASQNVELKALNSSMAPIHF
jgi:peptidoglycan/xylan/chitin deacetylase (PgdA/CDA1 family)